MTTAGTGVCVLRQNSRKKKTKSGGHTRLVVYVWGSLIWLAKEKYQQEKNNNTNMSWSQQQKPSAGAH